jgi:RHS repeat-associated protein
VQCGDLYDAPETTDDSNGNTLTKVVGSSTTTYSWDFENRMSSVTLPGSGGTVTFAYDPFGRRIKKVTSTTTSIFAYDGDNLVEETNSSGAAVARYEPTQNIDEPLAMLRSGATSYFHADGLGSISSLSNAAGSIANTYTYDSFGKLTASTGSLVNPFQYTARESDTETGLYYYRARYYDPGAGRFLSEDPIGFASELDFYTYARNNPIYFIDPRGLEAATGRPVQPNVNTVVCNGRDGIRVHLGGPPPAQVACAEECMRAHEEQHIRDLNAANPKVCEGVADGIKVGFSNLKERAATEVAASNIEISCLKMKKAGAGPACKTCNRELLDQRIKQMERYRDKNLNDFFL